MLAEAETLKAMRAAIQARLVCAQLRAETSQHGLVMSKLDAALVAQLTHEYTAVSVAIDVMTRFGESLTTEATPTVCEQCGWDNTHGPDDFDKCASDRCPASGVYRTR